MPQPQPEKETETDKVTETETETDAEDAYAVRSGVVGHGHQPSSSSSSSSSLLSSCEQTMMPLPNALPLNPSHLSTPQSSTLTLFKCVVCTAKYLDNFECSLCSLCGV